VIGDETTKIICDYGFEFNSLSRKNLSACIKWKWTKKFQSVFVMNEYDVAYYNLWHVSFCDHCTLQSRKEKMFYKVKTNVGWVFFFLVIVKFRYLKNKKLKELSKFECLFLINSKKCPMSLRNPKKGNYEVGVRIRICD
jgi:hypothetical protein